MAVQIDKPLIVITGPTASGKTSMAIRLAKKHNGEIICADSRTIYRGMNIGTAKPTTEDQALVPHHGLDLVEPGERFTVADFQQYARVKIEDIRQRGKVPFLVGGTGLYIDAVLFGYSFNEHDDRTMLIDNVIAVAIATEKHILRSQIAERAEQLFEQGVVDEAILLGKKYGWDNPAMTGNIYPLVRQHLEGGLGRGAIVDKFITLDRQLAKRQLTWLRRNPHLMWVSLSGADEYITSRLQPE